MLYSVRDILLHLKNPHTQLKYFAYLKRYDALDPSIGLAYRMGRLERVHIY